MGVTLTSTWSFAGAWMWWDCPEQGKRAELATDGSISLSALGGRFDTIKKYDDKQAAAADSWKRNVTLPLSDPRFDAVRAAMEADIAAAK